MVARTRFNVTYIACLLFFACSTGKMQLMAQQSVTYYPCGKLICNGNQTGNLVRRSSYVIPFLWVKHVSPIEIHRLLIEIYGDDALKAQNVRKWYRLFENCRTSVHNHDRNVISGIRHAVNEIVILLGCYVK